MADLISEIIDPKVFEEVARLTAQMETLLTVTDKVISLGASNNKSILGDNMKSANDATANLTSTTNKLIETESERLNIERQIKAEGEKMASAVKIESNAIEQAAAKYKMFANSQKEAKAIVIRAMELYRTRIKKFSI